MFRNLLRVALVTLAVGAGVLGPWPGGTTPTAQAQPVPWSRPLGRLQIIDNFSSTFALYSNQTWAALPNRTGGTSFIASSLFPPAGYTAGYWRYDPLLSAVILYGSDRTVLASINGLNPWVPAAQWGITSPWPTSPPTNWSFLP